MTMNKIIILTLFLAASCTTNTSKEKNNTTSTPASKPLQLIRFDSPTSGDVFTAGQDIKIDLALIDTIQPDSIVLFKNNTRWLKTNKLSVTLKTEKGHPGTLMVNAIAWKNGRSQSASISLKLKSDITPQEYTYKVIKTYPHDPNAYTQGLIFHNGFLYEGTGQQGASTLRKVELETGKVIQSLNLSREYFGEGIAMLNDKIYQLTWTNGVGFVYDAATFKTLHTFGYSTQGWGLTTNGNELIMSDGSHIIYFMEPNGFSETHRIEVYDDNGPVKMLNELEYINGKIYANIYLTDDIIIINPESGAVEGRIDMRNLLKPNQRTGNEDVLNGIAYDPENNRIFVTGKLWSKLFQVEFIKKE
ncbi:glutaminyl-peptide cyclotransferase [Tenuifilum thalassicum]|uniref:Glutaminyl-peptide cyclotransferase n=2 Tax=Tenuifilum thalassicum TaxID=2590900 RepID=A0A7D4C7A2_9BACT|nr:glutaminyl-peptide cyclotransferase [Tenuifilum thalassicum]